eukprot:gene712-8964_t
MENKKFVLGVFGIASIVGIGLYWFFSVNEDERKQTNEQEQKKKNKQVLNQFETKKRILKEESTSLRQEEKYVKESLKGLQKGKLEIEELKTIKSENNEKKKIKSYKQKELNKENKKNLEKEEDKSYAGVVKKTKNSETTKSKKNCENLNEGNTEKELLLIYKNSISMSLSYFLRKHIYPLKKEIKKKFGCVISFQNDKEELFITGNQPSHRGKTVKFIKEKLFHLNWEFIKGEWIETDRIYKEEREKTSDIPAKDRIFKRVNQYNEKHTIDLHSLYRNEATEILDEKLSQFKTKTKITIITGRLNHTEHKILTDHVEKYLKKKNIMHNEEKGEFSFYYPE